MLGVVALFGWISRISQNSGFSKLLTREKQQSGTHTFDDVSMANCEDYAVMISASKLAKRKGTSKEWILNNYQIEIFADTIRHTPKVIGHVPPSGHCYIIEQSGDWFFIQSPGSNELGWLHQRFVVGFVKMDPITLLPCPGRM